MKRKLSVYQTGWPLKIPFRITGKTFQKIDPIVVEIGSGDVVGRGEGVGVYYLDETAESMRAEVEAIRAEVEDGLSRVELLDRMPAGGARNAVDCALWDLEARLGQTTVAEIAGISPAPVRTVWTISIEREPDMMAAKARVARDFPVLKVKLDGDRPIERLEAIRRARPDADLIVDANQGFSPELLAQVLPEFAVLGVSMLEQPLPRGADQSLANIKSPVPICADESCLHRGELEAALERYDMINIKLDKAGGLTEGLALAAAVRKAGKKVMVGNMMGTSLSMAPAWILAQVCDLVDLDGPLYLCNDYLGGLRYDGPLVHPTNSSFWGAAEHAKVG